MRIPVPGDTALVILLPDDVSVVIDRWRRVYDPHYKIVPPHITVAFPFMPEHVWFRKRAVIDDCLNSCRAFDITFREVKQFTGNPLVLWLKPEDEGDIMQIHNALEERFSDYFAASEFAFTPHLTVGFFDTEVALIKAKKKISKELNSMYFRVSELIYMALGPDNVWLHRDRIYLK